MPTSKIRTLVVDDSVFMRTVLKSALSSSAHIELVGSAQNGNEALEKLKTLKPDVMTLDIEMPGLDGLEVLRRVMTSNPLPVVMVSTKTQEGAEMTFEALELGAVDFVAKPLAEKGTSLQSFREKVVRAVEAAFSANRDRLGKRDKTRIISPRAREINAEGIVVAIGISAGGPATLHKLVPFFPKTMPPIVLTQHMPAGFTAPFAARLNANSELTVKEAETGDELVPGQLLIAPGNRHLRIESRAGKTRATLDDSPKVAGFRPSVDVLFESVARTAGEKAIALIMTGMGCDGTKGIKKVKGAGGRTLAQDRDSSIVYGMPKAAFESGCVDRVISLTEIPDVLTRMLAAAEAPAT